MTERPACDLCGLARPECRPVCIEGRQAIPLVCDGCYGPLKQAGRIDASRETVVFNA